MRSPEAAVPLGAPFGPLLAKELREMASGRPLWTMLLMLCPLIGFSFFQAVSLYGETSATALTSPGLASALSPLDGVLVPTFGGFYVAVTLLFPFVAIRVLGNEKESGALRLLIQLPYRPPTLIGAKLVAVFAAWLIASIPAPSALAIWEFMGGHLFVAETLNVVLGHLLYGLLVGAIALFAAALTESAATAAIVTLGFTLGRGSPTSRRPANPTSLAGRRGCRSRKRCTPLSSDCCRSVWSSGCLRRFLDLPHSLPCGSPWVLPCASSLSVRSSASWRPVL
ncbi:ABC transporter permease [Mesorhizobium sp. C280B]|uniref:ABC transporter permease n=1 Tax=unclassified Mesorhizobium TaxID=325217 RepID=UPI001FD8CCF9|nr:ABC transporter permease [Mesorhizobium sp. LSJC280B00]